LNINFLTGFCTFSGDHQDSYLKINNKVVHLTARYYLNEGHYFESKTYRTHIQFDSIENKGSYSTIEGSIIVINKIKKMI